jgi:hypothetical protein
MGHLCIINVLITVIDRMLNIKMACAFNAKKVCSQMIYFVFDAQGEMEFFTTFLFHLSSNNTQDTFMAASTRIRRVVLLQMEQIASERLISSTDLPMFGAPRQLKILSITTSTVFTMDAHSVLQGRRPNRATKFARLANQDFTQAQLHLRV